jgi:hypothetical protein
MIKRLLFDGVHLERSRCTIAKIKEFAIVIDANKTKTSLTRMDAAMTRAKITMDAAAAFRLPPSGFVKLRSLLEDLQIIHGPPPKGKYSALSATRVHQSHLDPGRWGEMD